MRKLRLEADDLAVTSFETGGHDGGTGTVGAHAVTGTHPFCQTVQTYCRTGCPCTTRADAA
jgi:hypothetical protein